MGINKTSLPELHPRYEIQEQVGEGGMSFVYKAWDRILQKWIVLKCAGPDLANPSAFLREYEILYNLQHRHLPKVYDLYSSPDKLFFAMDWVEGKNLSEYDGAGQKLTPSLFYSVFFQLLSSLQYCHNHGIVHYDLKPENIVLQNDAAGSAASIILIDFGLAQIESEVPSDTGHGTIQYSSPEIIKKEKTDRRSDLYALGVILLEMAVGKNPFDDANVVNVVVNHLEKKISSIDSGYTFVTEDIKKIILKLLEKDPQYRYQNVEEIYRDLNPMRSQFQPIELEDHIVLHSCFVNRDRELAQLTEAAVRFFTEELPDKISTFWITGEEGAGKSALLKQFKMRLERDGCAVLSLHTAPSHTRNQVRSFLRHIYYLTQTAKPSDEFIREWEWIQDTNPENLPEDRDILFSGLSDLVLGSLKNIPRLCVIIDDGDQRNDFENDFFGYLLRKLTFGSPCKIAFYMSAARHETPFIQLENFDAPSTAAFIKTLLNDASVSEEITGKVFDATRGNPFLVHQTIEYLIQTNKLIVSNREWQLSKEEPISIPSSIQEFVQAKIKSLTSEDKQILEVASIFPSSFGLNEMRVISGDTALLAKLQRLVSRGLISHSNGSFIFSSQYLREHVYKNIPIDIVTQHHLNLAHHYESLDARKFISALAFHYFNSPERHKALPFLLELANMQKAAFLPSEALESFRQASSILRSMDQYESLFDTLFKMEELYDQLGRRKDQETILQEILDLADSQNSQQTILRGLLRRANYLERISLYEESQKVCEKAIILSKEETNAFLLGHLHRQLGRNFYNRAMWNKALDHYREAHRLALSSDDQKLEMECLNSLGTVYGSIGDYEQAKEYFIKSFELAEKRQDIERKINAVFNIARIFYKTNDLDQAIAYLNKTHTWIKSTRNKKLEQRLYQQSAVIYLDMHKYEYAYDYNEKVFTLSMELDDSTAVGRTIANQGLVYLRLGMYKQSQMHFRQAIERAVSLNNKKDYFNRRLYEVELQLAQGQYDNVVHNVTEALNYFQKDENPEHSFYAKLTLLHMGVETGFKDMSYSAVEKLTGPLANLSDIHRSGITASLKIQALYLLSRAMRLTGNLSKAVTYSNDAVALLDKQKYFEFSASEIYYNHYKTILGSHAPRSLIGNCLEKAFDKIKDIESNLKRSDFKSSFMSLPINQEIINEYKHFFSEEREFDIQSFQVLYEITQNINSILDSEALFDRIMDNAIENTKSDRGLILIKSETSDQFDMKVARNIDQETLSDMTHISQSIVQEVYQTGQSIVTADANLDDRFKARKSIVAYNIRSIMCVPLKIKSKVIGAVYVDKQFDTNYFSPRNLKFLESFANIAGIAIENARLYEKLNLEKDYLSKENMELKSEIQEKFLKYNIIGNSKMMKQVFQLIENAADNTANVLIEGESGTGKELVAKAIHYNGSRKNKKIVAVDCGALPENLLESELFGYKKGAFTGASSDKKGLFEEADGGTIFLDEITNTSLNFQSRLLRVIQEGEIRRVGDNDIRKVNVRTIVATNRNLLEQVKAGLFREDLYYRLNVIPISLPPLRDRKEDIPLLVQFFLDKHNKLNNKNIQTVSNELMERLMWYPWPGNIRELENILSRMIIFATQDKLTSETLPDEIRKSKPFDASAGAKQPPAMTDFAQKSLEQFESEAAQIEKDYFSKILEKAGGNKTKAAEILGIKRTTLNDRLKKLGL
ncbi:sigma 54-interacting transcriptional regulator [bacterium]|nr:sigma 54-interacting transcriptional regulator [bacterium]